MLSHRNLLRVAVQLAGAADAAGRAASNFMPFPLCHVAGYRHPGLLAAGHTLVLRPAYEPEDFMRQVRALPHHDDADGARRCSTCCCSTPPSTSTTSAA